MIEKESDIKDYIFNIAKKEKVFCGVENSTCNKNLRFYNHSFCCLKCEYNCTECTVKKTSQCDQFCSKEDIILDRINKISKEKDKYIKALEIIENEIKSLSKMLTK